MVRFYDASKVFGVSSTAEQKLFQVVQALVAVSKAPRAHALSGLIQHIHVMVG